MGKRALLVLSGLFLGFFLNPEVFQQERPKPIKARRLLKRVSKKLTYARKRLKRGLLKDISRQLDLAMGEEITTYPQEVLEAMELITSDYMERVLYYLAGRKIRERGSGLRGGGKKATRFIAKEFKRFGLKAVGDKDRKRGGRTYFQRFGGGRNCLGALEGSDDELKTEVIVVGGHCDHPGPGAHDNGSGTVAVMSIARAFGESGLRPKRTILFILFDREEAGLMGSSHYVNRPVYPLRNHVLMVNFDMVGDKRSPVVVNNVGSFARRNRKIIKGILKRSSKEQGLKVNPEGGTGRGNPTDSGSFARRHIPTLWFHTWGILHSPRDTAEKIAYDRMEQIVRCAFLTIWELANMEEFPGGRKVRGIGKRLGLGTQELTSDELSNLRERLKLAEDQGALRVTSVIKGTVAEKAGFKKGDLIIQFGENILPQRKTKRKFLKFLRKAKRGKEIQVVVIRQGQREILKVFWEKKRRKRRKG